MLEKHKKGKEKCVFSALFEIQTWRARGFKVLRKVCFSVFQAALLKGSSRKARKAEKTLLIHDFMRFSP